MTPGRSLMAGVEVWRPHTRHRFTGVFVVPGFPLVFLKTDTRNMGLHVRPASYASRSV